MVETQSPTGFRRNPTLIQGEGWTPWGKGGDILPLYLYPMNGYPVSTAQLKRHNLLSLELTPG